MNILFVAKHGSGDNDDEGAVTYALRQLGHRVTTVHEMRKHRDANQTSVLQNSGSFEFCLFFKWPVVSEIAALKCPAAFWYFDMVRSVEDDPSLKARSDSRVRWMTDVLPLPNVVAGFCTDGDWVETGCPQSQSGKLVHLMQGADERFIGPGVTSGPITDILFTGMKHHGRKRADHIDHLQKRWGSRFVHAGEGGPKRRVHGRELADMLCSAKVIVAPDGPCTDRYWSNRVYLTTGFGAFLVHPRCAGLERQYSDRELVMYSDRYELDEIIEYALGHPDWRATKAANGLRATTTRHLYRHRCEELVRVMKERI